MLEAPTRNTTTSLFMCIVWVKIQYLSLAKVAVPTWVHSFGPICNVFANQGHVVAIINKGRNSDRRSNAGRGSRRGYVDEFSWNLWVICKGLSELCENLLCQACGNEKAEDSSLHVESRKRYILAMSVILRSIRRAKTLKKIRWGLNA